MSKDKTKIEKRLNIQLWLSVVVVAFGLLMLTASFIVPPVGVIEASVLAALGELLTFAGSVMGIDYSYKHKNYKMKLDQQKVIEATDDEV